MTRTRDLSALSPEFAGLLRRWLANRDEILIMVRFSHAAGNREYRLFRDIEDVRSWLMTLRPKTSVIAFRSADLPLRGTINEAFTQRCLRELPDGAEYLVVHAEPWLAGNHTWFHYDSGTSHLQLVDDLNENPGAQVAVGLHPDWLADTDDVVEALIPNANGEIERGIY